MDHSESEKEVRGAVASRRSVLGGVAAGSVASLLASTRLPLASAQEASIPPSGLPPFIYHLEGSEPTRFTGGTLRTATVENIPALKDFAIFAEQIDAGAMRELHWHSNCGELNYCLSGEGTIGVFSPSGDNATFDIKAGSITYIPIGYAHYIQNRGAEPLHMVIAFTSEKPEHFDFSVTLPWFPGELIAQALGVVPGTLPMLSRLGDLSIVPATLPADLTLTEKNAFSVQTDQLSLDTYAGGTARPVKIENISSLADISLFVLDVVPRGMREPHWHTNASEFNYCVTGTAQIGIVAPDGSSQTFVVEPGDVAYIPSNWFHYIASVSDEPLQLLVFFGNVKPDHIDLSQIAVFFPPEVLAASFDLDPSVFAGLPDQGDVFVAAPPK
jgi:oxalate decarboxylase